MQPLPPSPPLTTVGPCAFTGSHKLLTSRSEVSCSPSTCWVLDRRFLCFFFCGVSFSPSCSCVSSPSCSCVSSPSCSGVSCSPSTWCVLDRRFLCFFFCGVSFSPSCSCISSPSCSGVSCSLSTWCVPDRRFFCLLAGGVEGAHCSPSSGFAERCRFLPSFCSA